jgi:hypothetical protein
MTSTLKRTPSRTTDINSSSSLTGLTSDQLHSHEEAEDNISLMIMPPSINLTGPVSLRTSPFHLLLDFLSYFLLI